MSPIEASLYVAADKSQIPSILNPYIVNVCKTSIAKRGRFVIAMSGGSLPGFLGNLNESFQAAGDDPKYGCWHVILADERCVPETDPDSNLAAIKENFLSKVPIPANQIYGIDESKLAESTDAVALEYEAKLKKLLSVEDGFIDLALLGFGPDVSLS